MLFCIVEAKAQLRLLKQESEASEKRCPELSKTLSNSKSFWTSWENEQLRICLFARLKEELQEQVDLLRQEQEHEVGLVLFAAKETLLQWTIDQNQSLKNSNKKHLQQTKLVFTRLKSCRCSWRKPGLGVMNSAWVLSFAKRVDSFNFIVTLKFQYISWAKSVSTKYMILKRFSGFLCGGCFPKDQLIALGLLSSFGNSDGAFISFNASMKLIQWFFPSGNLKAFDVFWCFSS